MIENDNTYKNQHVAQKYVATHGEGASGAHIAGHHEHALDRIPDGKYPSRLLAERIFDASVYGVWNYVIQAGSSVAAATYFTEGAGRPYFDKAAEWVGKNIMETITSKRGEAAIRESHTPLIFVSLITVGNLFIPPMRYAERHKAHYVSKINDWLNMRREAAGDGPSEEERMYQQRAIEKIANDPIQTNASLWGGRFAGLAANFVAAGLVGEDRNVRLKNGFANLVSKGFDAVGMTTMAESKTVKAVSRNAFLDYGYSMIGANVVYIYSHYINPPKAKLEQKDPKTDSQSLDEGRPIPSVHPAVIQHSAGRDTAFCNAAMEVGA